MKVEMTELTREEAQVLYKLNTGIPILQTAFTPPADRKYYALTTLKVKGRQLSAGNRRKTNPETLLSLTPKNHEFVRGGGIVTAYEITRKKLNNNLKNKITRADLQEAIQTKMKVENRQASNFITHLIFVYGLLRIVENESGS